MGVEVLDVTFRLEKAFDLRMPWGAFLEEAADPQTRYIRVGRLHEVVCNRLIAAGRPVPFSSWHRVQRSVVDAICVKVRSVKRDSWLFKDLGCS